MAFNTRGSSGYSEKMRIEDNGNVGIGTDSPSGKFHVVGAGGLTGGTPQNSGSNNQIVIENNASSGSADIQMLGPTNGYNHIFFGDADDANIGVIYYNHNNNSLNFTTNANSGTMILTSDGNVGIGTTNPGGSRLYLQDNHTTTVTNATTMLSNTTLTINGNSSGGSDVIRVGPMNVAGKYFIDVSNSAGTAAYDLLLNPIGGGNVGIGMASASDKLDIQGADNGLTIRSIQANRPKLTLINGTSTMMTLSANGTYAAIGDGSDANRYMAFNGGKVGIGTTSPQYPLDVRGVFISPIGNGSTHTGASSTQYPITNRSIINGRLNLSFNVYFQHNTSNLAVRLYAPVASLWISGEVIFGSTYSYGNASGFRRYTFTHNQNSASNYNYSLTNTENRGSTSSQFELHSHGWDSSENAHYFEFRHIVSSGNQIYCQFQTFGSGSAYETANWYYRHVTY